jgi:nicotinamidase/pyrazinamidase
MMNVHLLIIDPQNDFCDPSTGALYVAGADEDMNRLADMIDRLGDSISDIHVTLDSHHLNDIAHPNWWRDSAGNPPSPFTIITADDVEKQVWTTTVPSLYRRSLEYVKSLESNKRYPLCIWPPHCLIGTSGAAIWPRLMQSLNNWNANQFMQVDFVTKGSNVFTEHYSAIKADVPDPIDPTTQINTRLISALQSADLIAIAGEASSHCVANTVRDIADAFGDDSYVKKLVFITDASSPVGGFESFSDDFIKEMTGRGMQISTTADFLLRQTANV